MQFGNKLGLKINLAEKVSASVILLITASRDLYAITWNFGELEFCCEFVPLAFLFYGIGGSLIYVV